MAKSPHPAGYLRNRAAAIGLAIATSGAASGVFELHAGPQAIEAIGRRLFFDSRLSADNSMSCAKCHQPERAFSDGQPLAAGVNGLLGMRNTPSLVEVSAQRSLFWDGRRASLEQQALDPLLNDREHGL